MQKELERVGQEALETRTAGQVALEAMRRELRRHAEVRVHQMCSISSRFISIYLVSCL